MLGIVVFGILGPLGLKPDNMLPFVEFCERVGLQGFTDVALFVTIIGLVMALVTVVQTTNVEIRT